MTNYSPGKDALVPVMMSLSVETTISDDTQKTICGAGDSILVGLMQSKHLMSSILSRTDGDVSFYF